MAVDFKGANATQLFQEACWFMSMNAVEEASRNGPVLTIPRPVTFSLTQPRRRHLFYARRKPNHVFHVMEFIWMMAGMNDVTWLTQFNKNISRYTEDNIMHGAYGHRWSRHFEVNQLSVASARLKKNPDDRQVVVTMWDPNVDLRMNRFRDRPCNTQIFFRVDTSGRLDMHVINRSNDLIWGALGSNIVHFTMLQEVMARVCGYEIGTYYVTTNNLHVYKELPQLARYLSEGKNLQSPGEAYGTAPILSKDSYLDKFVWACQNFILDDKRETTWFEDVAGPMKDWYLNKDERSKLIGRVIDPSWRFALRQFNGEQS